MKNEQNIHVKMCFSADQIQMLIDLLIYMDVHTVYTNIYTVYTPTYMIYIYIICNIYVIYTHTRIYMHAYV